MTPFILSQTKKNIGILTLNNPTHHNVLNPNSIFLLQDNFHRLQNDQNVDVIFLHANGQHFCVGADLKHMQKIGIQSKKENEHDAGFFTQLFELIYFSKKPTICGVHGHVYGGGIGLLAACDIVLADPKTQFCFSEVKLGLIPATIAPFVLQRLSYQSAKYYMLSAIAFDANEAKNIGLIDQIIDTDSVLDAGLAFASCIAQNEIGAMIQTKKWLNVLKPIDQSTLQQAACLLAEMRAGHEAQKRMQAFLSK